MILRVDIKEDVGDVGNYVGHITEILPASWMRPINSLRPMLSKSITITSNEHSRIFSHGTLNENASLNTGFSVHLNIGVFRFSILLSPNCNQTFT